MGTAGRHLALIVGISFIALAVAVSCQPNDNLTLTLTVDKPIYSVGELPIVTALLVNNSSSAVVVPPVEYVIESASLEKDGAKVGTSVVPGISEDDEISTASFATLPSGGDLQLDVSKFFRQDYGVGAFVSGAVSREAFVQSLPAREIYGITLVIPRRGTSGGFEKFDYYPILGTGDFRLRLVYRYSGPDDGNASVLRGPIVSSVASFSVR